MDATSKAKNKIKVGLIGLGAIGKVHTQCYSMFQKYFPNHNINLQIVNVLEPSINASDKIFQEIGNPELVNNLEDFFKQKYDLVDVCTPNFLHLTQVTRAIEESHHVYCEKPLGKNLEDASKIADYAKEKGTFSNTSFVYRYLPAFSQMKSIIAAGGIGEVMNFRAQMFLSSYINPEQPITWRLKKDIAGGGALVDLGVHMIDLARFFFGEVDWVQCQTRTVIDQRPSNLKEPELGRNVDVDDWALCTLGMRNKAVGVIEVTRLAGGMGRMANFEVYGREGTLIANLGEPENVRFYSRKNNEWSSGQGHFPDATGIRSSKQVWVEKDGSLNTLIRMHLASITDMLLCMRDGEIPMNNFQSALATQKVMEQAYKSADSNGIQIHLAEAGG
ncbi:MAG TPA: hypothetical protein DCK95_04445 [Anaerolineaceae bacterium]|nr:hypothetical protein [Anaerolineaceae bacterium]